ncbi:uncharacterized protein LOC106653766 [Trichogramma pretiosum]|uniref:uncharacterized protein LOC106653766 n=1 Tax=Trichogramma pretiosum TaxID=7493 RepID=UPI000C718AF4|nr:uncharacterized protein LOC106653766 [Trichogramma pretiosum]
MECQNTLTCQCIMERIFSNWHELKKAIEHGMGSYEQARSFVLYIVEIFKMNDELDVMDLSAELYDYMEGEFQIQLEDNSEKEVAQRAIRFHKLFKNNDLRSIEIENNKLPPFQPWILSNRTIRTATITSNATEEDSSDDETGGSSQSPTETSPQSSSTAMEIDEDDWSIVGRRKK